MNHAPQSKGWIDDHRAEPTLMRPQLNAQETCEIVSWRVAMSVSPRTDVDTTRRGDEGGSVARSSLKIVPDKEGKNGHEGTEHPGGGKSKVLITGRRRRKMLPRMQEDGSLLANPHKGNSNPAPGNLTPHGKSLGPPAASSAPAIFIRHRHPGTATSSTGSVSRQRQI